MLSTIRIIVSSAVLSAVVVGTFWKAEAPTSAPASSKLFVERASAPLANAGMAQTNPALSSVRGGQKADRLEVRSNACQDAAWPYIPDQCISEASVETPRIVRTVALETRNGENTSVLVKMPQTVVAAR
jgi:hypothetical protein